jgi:hypothetical protein
MSKSLYSEFGKKQKKIRQITDRDGKFCAYCLGDVKFASEKGMTVSSTNLATLDHVVTQKDGGTYHNTNLVCACYSCNQMRDTMPPEDYRAALVEFGGKAKLKMEYIKQAEASRRRRKEWKVEKFHRLVVASWGVNRLDMNRLLDLFIFKMSRLLPTTL